jgi:hypothetical protein
LDEAKETPRGNKRKEENTTKPSKELNKEKVFKHIIIPIAFSLYLG